MKTFIATFLFLSGSFAFAQNADEKEFQRMIKNLFQEVFSDLDSTRIDQYLTKEFILFEDGEVFNNDSVKLVINNLIQQFNSDENKNRKFKRINSFEFLNAHSDGNSGWIYYRNFAEFKMDGTTIARMHWLESANFIKTKDGWRIAFLHSTIVKEK